jgi:hypothetical protein
LVFGDRPREPGWRGALGQIGAAAGHLKNQGVGLGDIFLFYGWFRVAVSTDGRFHFRKHESGFHAIFGYLEVGEVLSSPTLLQLPNWLRDHPHALPHRLAKRTNTFYVATRALSSDPSRPGWGTFKFNPPLMLSHPAMSRSRWCLDPLLFQHLTISYHTSNAWRDGYFQSYPRAQEYVIQADDAAEAWAHRLIRRSDNLSE